MLVRDAKMRGSWGYLKWCLSFRAGANFMHFYANLGRFTLNIFMFTVPFFFFKRC